MDVAIIGLVGVLVGVAITTVTNYLLAVRNEAAEERNWRRDRSLEAYTDVLRACNSLTEADALYGAECNTEEHVKQCRIVLEKTAEMYRMADRAYLLSPKEMHQSLNALTLYCGKAIGEKSIKCPKLSSTEWATTRKGLAPLYAKFANGARNDLGIHEPLHSIDEWIELTTQRKP